MEIPQRLRKNAYLWQSNELTARMKNDNPNTSPRSAAAGSPAGRDKKTTAYHAFPSVGDLFALLGIVLGAQIVVGLVMGLVRLALYGADFDVTASPATAGRLMAVSYLASMSLALGAILLYRRMRGGRGPVVRLSRRGLNPVLLGWAFLLIIGAGIVLEPLTARLPGPSYEHMGLGLWTVVALVVLAPLFEETICRGVVLEALRSRWGVVAAWFFSSLFFGVMHIYPAQVVSAWAIGLVIGFVCIATGSLWGAMVLHAANNALAYTMLSLGYGDVTLREALGGGWGYTAAYAAAVALCLVSGWMMRRTLLRLKAAAADSPKAAGGPPEDAAAEAAAPEPELGASERKGPAM